MGRLTLWLTAVAGLALVACSAPQTPAGSGGADPGAPKSGGILNTIGDDLTDFDLSNQGKTIENSRDHGLVYDTLLRFKRGPDIDFVSQILQPRLAERWEVSPDGKSFTYYLHRGARFANVAPVNARELTSADVKWSMEYYSRTGEFADKKLNPSQMAPLFEGLDGVETPDPYTVRVRFKDGFAPFPNYSASQWMPIAAHEVFEADGNLTKQLVGSGPYILDLANSQKGSVWVFTRNPNYWGPKPYLDGIRRLVITDESTKAAAFMVKQVDILAVTGNYAAALDIKKNNPDATMAVNLNPGHRHLFLSQKSVPLQDIRVRRAISLGFDRDEYNNVWSGGKGAWAMTGSFPGLMTDAEAHEMLKYDPEQAKRLLAEAGYGGGLKLTMMPLAAPGIPEQLLQAQMKRIGIEVSFVVLPREQNRAKLYVGDFDMVSQGDGGINDADFDGLQYSYHSTSPQNWSVIKDSELDKLVVAQRRESDPAKRREAQRAVVKRIHEMSWNPGGIFAAKIQLWHPYVKNFAPHFAVGEDDAYAWLDK